MSHRSPGIATNIVAGIVQVGGYACAKGEQMAKQKPEAWEKKLAIYVRRDYDGKVFSMVVDENHPRRLKYGGLYMHEGTVVIDRANGRQFDPDTVIRRAQAMAELTGHRYDEDLTWPCKAKAGFKDCNCPGCVESANERAKKVKK